MRLPALEKGIVWKYAVSVLIVSALYVVSVGPVYGILFRLGPDPIAVAKAERVYTPLSWVAAKSRATDTVERWKVLWINWMVTP